VRNKANWPRAPGNGRGPGGPLRDRLRQTRRPRQKSPSRVSTSVSGPISRIGSVEADFCRARQTKPISRRAWRVGCAKQSQSRQRVERVKCFMDKELWSIRHACETKPIWRWPAGIQGRIVPNKPNFGEPAGRTGGVVVQTKPTPPFHYSSIRRPKPDCEKQSQFRGVPRGLESETCETKPNLGGLGHVGNCSGPTSPGSGTCETNPIRGDAAWDVISPTRGERTKQTQFPRWGGQGCCTNEPNSCHCADPEIGVPGRANRAKQSQLAQGRVLWVPRMSNKPNHGQDAHATAPSVAQNKANLGRTTGWSENRRPPAT
jgi:hypothetical protein